MTIRLPIAVDDDIATDAIDMLSRAARAKMDSRQLLFDALIEARGALGIKDDFVPFNIPVALVAKIEIAIEHARKAGGIKEFRE